MAHLYILQNKEEGYYIGITTLDPNERLARHNKGDVSSTKKGKMWRVIYTEYFDNIKIARRREKQIKGWKGGNAFKKLMSKTAGSSNGRMRLSESRHLGSNPSPAVLDISAENKLAG